MKNLRIVGALLAGALLFGAAYFGVRAVRSRAAGDRAARPSQGLVGAQTASPADRRIRAGEAQVKQRPQSPDGYNLLAAAYMQKARETGDFGFNAKAEAALAESSRVAPDNYDAIKLRAKLLLTYHRFTEALAEARRAQRLRPEDHDAYGALTDACVELGDYDCAVASAQTMVDLRPDASSYARVSYLRSLHGDREGAIEAMLVAVKAADPRDPESVAWFRTHLGDELLNAGRPAEAEREYGRALAVFPDYHVALAAQARARRRGRPRGGGRSLRARAGARPRPRHGRRARRRLREARPGGRSAPPVRAGRVRRAHGRRRLRQLLAAARTLLGRSRHEARRGAGGRAPRARVARGHLHGGRAGLVPLQEGAARGGAPVHRARAAARHARPADALPRRHDLRRVGRRAEGRRVPAARARNQPGLRRSSNGGRAPGAGRARGPRAALRRLRG